MTCTPYHSKPELSLTHFRTIPGAVIPSSSRLRGDRWRAISRAGTLALVPPALPPKTPTSPAGHTGTGYPRYAPLLCFPRWSRSCAVGVNTWAPELGPPASDGTGVPLTRFKVRQMVGPHDPMPLSLGAWDSEVSPHPVLYSHCIYTTFVDQCDTADYEKGQPHTSRHDIMPTLTDEDSLTSGRRRAQHGL